MKERKEKYKRFNEQIFADMGHLNETSTRENPPVETVRLSSEITDGVADSVEDFMVRSPSLLVPI